MAPKRAASARDSRMCPGGGGRGQPYSLASQLGVHCQGHKEQMPQQCLESAARHCLRINQFIIKSERGLAARQIN